MQNQQGYVTVWWTVVAVPTSGDTQNGYDWWIVWWMKSGVITATVAEYTPINCLSVHPKIYWQLVEIIWCRWRKFKWKKSNQKVFSCEKVCKLLNPDKLKISTENQWKKLLHDVDENVVMKLNDWVGCPFLPFLPLPLTQLVPFEEIEQKKLILFIKKFFSTFF